MNKKKKKKNLKHSLKKNRVAATEKLSHSSVQANWNSENFIKIFESLSLQVWWGNKYQTVYASFLCCFKHLLCLSRSEAWFLPVQHLQKAMDIFPTAEPLVLMVK